MTTQIHECHPHDTKEQLYDVRLHDVELHDVANTCFANVCMKTNFKKNHAYVSCFWWNLFHKNLLTPQLDVTIREGYK